MTVSRPALLRVGDEVRLAAGVHTVVALSGVDVDLIDVTGETRTVPVGQMLADPSFVVITKTARRAPVAPEGLLAELPQQVVDQARWWEAHLIEVLAGRPADAVPGSPPRPEFDPKLRSLRQREIAKVTELTALGHEVALSTVQRLRRAYETRGVLGLVDGRSTRQPSPRCV
jgi:hypothetical protein